MRDSCIWQATQKMLKAQEEEMIKQMEVRLSPPFMGMFYSMKIYDAKVHDVIDLRMHAVYSKGTIVFLT